MNGMMKALVWKEIRQQMWFLAIGAVAGLVFVFLDLYQRHLANQNLQTLVGSAIVACFGGVFALILGVATTWEDVRSRRCEFWSARPVSPGRMMGIKFLLGIVFLAAMFLVIQAADLFTFHKIMGGDRDVPASVIYYIYPITFLLFGAGMVLTAVLRDAVKAVFLALWFGLLIYFLPLLFNALSWFNFLDLFVLRDCKEVGITPYLVFLSVTLGGSMVCLGLSVCAIRNHWRWEASQKTIAWTLGLTGALIFIGVMFQVGANLKSVKTWEGKPIDPTVKFVTPAERTEDWAEPKTAWTVPPDRPFWLGNNQVCASGDYLYLASTVPDKPYDWHYRVPPTREDWLLDVYQSPTVTGSGKHVAQIRFYVTPWKVPAWHNFVVRCHTRGNRLYVVYQPGYQEKKTSDFKTFNHWSLRVLTADISDPAKPKRVSDVELVPPILAQRTEEGGAAFDGEYGYVSLRSSLLVFTTASDRPRVVGTFSASQLHGPNVKRYGGYGEFLPPENLTISDHRLVGVYDQGVVILDVSDPRQPRMLAHKQVMTGNGSPWEIVRSALLDRDVLYVSRMDGLDVYRLGTGPEAAATLDRIGGRTAPPLERSLSMEKQGDFVIAGSLLYKPMGRFGLLVFDVSDPARPRRVYHATQQDGYWFGRWGGAWCLVDPAHSWGGATLVEAGKRAGDGR